MSTAQTLLEKIIAKSKTKTTLTIAGVDFTFHLDSAAYDTMVNDIEGNNKVTPIKDYLLAIVDPAQKEEFAPLLQVTGLALQVAKSVNEQLIPKVEITVKN